MRPKGKLIPIKNERNNHALISLKDQRTGANSSQNICQHRRVLSSQHDSSHMRLLFAFLLLAAIVLIPFAIWGEGLETIFSQEGTVSMLQEYGHWAWLFGIGLLMADLLLPLPNSLIMSAFGYVYGWFWGGLLAVVGSFLAGALGYELCRRIGERAVVWILGEKDRSRGASLFATSGGWLVALSRWLPVLTEVVACLAGLNRMPAKQFYLALLAGTLPLGFTYAAIGSMGVENPLWAIGVSILLPPVLWWSFRRWLRVVESSET